MKETLNIQSIKKLLPVIGFALLLLISPCTIRNFVQAELGIPQTEVTNKSKATATSTTCSAVEKPDINSAHVNSFESISFVLFKNTFFYTLSVIDASNQLSHGYIEEKQSLSLVPLYILHKNFKAYL